jgi:Transposase DDE domain
MRAITVKTRFEQVQVKSRIVSQLRRFHPDIRKTLVENIADFGVALVQAQHVHLSKMAGKVNRRGHEASREQGVRRQLDNATLGTWHLFRPMAECLLKGLVGHSVYLILDPTDLDEERCTVMIMLADHHRALPLIWLSFEMKPGLIGDSVTLLCTELKKWLPPGVKVYLLADREFHGIDMLDLICAQGWTPVVREKSTTTVTFADRAAQPLSALPPPIGQTAFYQHAWLTANQFGPLNLALACAPPKPGKKLDPWFIVSTEPASHHLLTLYEKRFWIDETFRDFKGYGFHFDQTGLHDPDRLDRLVLMIALACWWVLSLGIWLHRMGLRREVDRAKHPRLSLLQLGLRHINRLLHLGEVPDVELIPGLVGAL